MSYKKCYWMSILLLVISFTSYAQTEEVIVAGGCFWCVEADFDKLPGVLSTTSGFDGGKVQNPSYSVVSSGKTQYVESVKIQYDSTKLSYEDLLIYFFNHIDPTVKNRQFCDKGRQYRSVIFYLSKQQKKTALNVLKKVKKQFPQVYTQVLPSTRFYPAENYHQNYYKKNPVRYKYYRWRCGRDKRVKSLWRGKRLDK